MRSASRLLCLLCTVLACVGGPDAQPVVEQSVSDPLLAEQLALRVEADQAARGLWTLAFERGGAPTQSEVLLVVAIDSLNTAWLRNVVEGQGWPLVSEVGEQGSHDAWLLVQHADRAPDFQRSVLEEMREAVTEGEASGADFAYLTDRVHLSAGEPQVYGTQLNVVDGVPEPFELEAPHQVDARRASVGLPPLSEYIEVFRRNVLGLPASDAGGEPTGDLQEGDELE